MGADDVGIHRGPRNTGEHPPILRPRRKGAGVRRNPAVPPLLRAQGAMRRSVVGILREHRGIRAWSRMA